MSDSLEQRIEQVEQRLLARQQQLQHRWLALGQRVHQATEPRRLVVPAIGVVLSLLVGGWLLRRLGARRAQHLPAPPAAGVAGAGGGWRLFDPRAWMRGAVWLWPLLPLAWRARAGPGAASLFVALGLPWVEDLFKRRAPD